MTTRQHQQAGHADKLTDEKRQLRFKIRTLRNQQQFLQILDTIWSTERIGAKIDDLQDRLILLEQQLQRQKQMDEI